MIVITVNADVNIRIKVLKAGRNNLLISGVKALKKVLNEQKRLKTAEKSVLTSF